MVVLTVGNVGAGKSTLARRLAGNGFIVVNMDSLVTMFAGGKYVYHKNRAYIYRCVEDKAIQTLLHYGMDVVIDRTNMDAKTRRRYIDMCQDSTDIMCVNFGPGDASCLGRRIADGRDQSAETWTQVFKDKMDSYEKPVVGEGFRSVYHVSGKNDMGMICDDIVGRSFGV